MIFSSPDKRVLLTIPIHKLIIALEKTFEYNMNSVNFFLRTIILQVILCHSHGHYSCILSIYDSSCCDQEITPAYSGS
jgi:hypothetical protein